MMKNIKTPPEILRISPENENDVCDIADRHLRDGCLIVVPTDTVYGLAAHPEQLRAVEAIFEAKVRDTQKPAPLLAADAGCVLKHGARMNLLEKRLAEMFWPGPLTLVLEVGNGRTEGFRVPDHAFLRKLLAKSGGLLRVTSANISAQPPALTADEALRSLGGKVRLVIDGGTVKGGVSSTVARVKNGVIRILREGAVSTELLNRAAGDP